jgi:hypothetical protein
MLDIGELSALTNNAAQILNLGLHLASNKLRELGIHGYVIVGYWPTMLRHPYEIPRFYFQHITNIPTATGNSDMLMQDWTAGIAPSV